VAVTVMMRSLKSGSSGGVASSPSNLSVQMG
jgi:hypothetical protein